MDAIVNTLGDHTKDYPASRGPLFKNIIKAGGKGILDEIVNPRDNSYFLYHKGKVGITRGHNLPAKYVIHALLKNYSYGRNNFED